MQRNIHWIRLDVCDYTDKPLCNLYDSDKDVSGQAVDVVVHCERNGFKELSFQLPSMCSTENGQEKNYRLDYLVSDYKLKLQKSFANNDEIEIDWFLISETKVTHNAFSENYEIRASHVSKLLSIKRLDLEFSENEGNNVGTIKQIAQTILEGTGWHLGEVADFYEEKKYGQTEDTLKVRSFFAAVQTGAFKMMSDLCELFDAKPIYHGAGQYKSYEIVGERNGQSVVYQKNCDEYEADKTFDKAEQSGLINVKKVDTGMITGKTVDILPMNPFSEDYEEGTIPKNIINDKVIELHYDKNIQQITRTLNTENLITKLSAYGSYGDRNGMCSLQRASHFVLTMPDVSANNQYRFEFNSAYYYFTATSNASGLKWSSLDFASRSYVYNGNVLFKVYKTPLPGGYHVFTQGDIQATEEINYLPFVMDFSYYEKIGLLTDDMLLKIAEFQTEIPQKYYEAEQAAYDLAETQKELSETASASNGFLKFDIEYAEIPGSDVCEGQLLLHLNTDRFPDGIIYRSDYDEAKRNYFSWNVAKDIKVKGEALAGIGAVVYIIKQRTGQRTSWTKTYVKMIGNKDGMFFSDDLGNYFTLKIKRPYNVHEIGEKNILYEDADAEKYYVWNNNKYAEVAPCNYTYGLNNFDEPDRILLWTSENVYESGDLVYMFSADSVAGRFGPKEDLILNIKESIQNSTKVSTETHPMYFLQGDKALPSPESALQSYGWAYRLYDDDNVNGELFFCWGKAGGLNWSETYNYTPDSSIGGDLTWVRVFVSKGSENPEEVTPIEDYGYYYNYKRQRLYRRINNRWIPLNLDLNDSKDVNAAFKVVLNGCIEQEVHTKGLHEQYYYDVVNELPKGNYAFKNEYDNYWLFTTEGIVPIESRIKYYPENKTVWVDEDEHHILTSIERTFDVLDFPVNNELYGINFNEGEYDKDQNKIVPSSTSYISNNINGIHENTVYTSNLPNGSTILFYTVNATVKSTTQEREFETPSNTAYIRVVCPSVPTSEHYIRVKGYDTCFFAENKQYKILNCSSAGERRGIYYLMDKFIELSDRAYLVDLKNLRNAQEYINQANLDLANILGDMYREGYWQKNDYVEGDEYKLYIDTLDNLKEVSHPEATYDISYLDLYGAEKNIGLSVDEQAEDISYPDVDISFAAHLVDPEIDINCWAYIDKTDTCYDQMWKTSIEINTKLSMIGQQSFTDVLSHIAEVAVETKAKQSVYSRAQNLSSNGSLEGDKVEGSLETGKVFLVGGTSNWYTDEKGNIIFESSDSTSAFMLSGRGFLISQEKDQYGDWLWKTAIDGKGINGNVVNNKEDFGSTIDISSNPSIITLSSEVQNIVIEHITKADIDEICIL